MKFLFIIISLFSFSSCQKDRLEGTASALVGKWKWEYSIEFKQGNGQTVTTKIPSSNFEDSYTIEFDRKGKVTFYKNQEVQETNDIVFSILDSTSSLKFPVKFSINNNKGEHVLNGNFGLDSMHCSGQPISIGQNQSSGSVEYFYDHYYSKIK